MKKILIFLLLLSGITSLQAQQAESYNYPDPAKNDFDFIEDNFIVAALDSLSSLKYFESTESTKSRLYNNKYNFLPNFVPSYPDSVYYYRMQRLDVESPIELTYNPYVRMFIDLYANKKRGTTSRVLGLSQMYFPMIEQQLDKYNLPLELKYLAIVESALNAKARSRVGAGGLWQFMYYTGKVYGLELNSYVDDRNDPMKATVAACRHFKDLYNMYHDWLLVLAAYNSGPGNVNKAIRRSGGKMTFWEIMPYLPRETRDYVPAFIAVNYVMAYSNEHNIYPVMPKIVYHETDTVAVTQPITFALLSEKLKLAPEEIEFLNPTFRQGFIPATPANPFYIRLPQRSIADFINNEDALYAFYKLKGFDATQFLTASQNEVEYETITRLITHKVRKGETIMTVARRYDCSASEIKRWNKLRKSALKRGQALKIYIKDRRPIAAKPPKSNPNLSEVTAKNDSARVEAAPEKKVQAARVVTVKPRYHVVKRGESLGKVASKFGVTTKNLMAWNNLRSSKVVVGQRLRVNAPGTRIINQVAEEEIADIAPEKTGKTPVEIKTKDTASSTYHIVKKGEYLGRIAAKYGVSADDLREWNSLADNNVQAGQKLTIRKPAGEAKPATAGTSKKTVSDNEKLVYYTVKPGDTLWSISQKYSGVTIDQLKEWNKLAGGQIKIGQKLKVILPTT